MDEHIEKVSEDFSYRVAKDLESTIEDKHSQVKWKDDINGLSRRFHNMFKLGELHIAEISFSSMSGDYRAICVVIPDGKYVVYYTTVPKNGSSQERTLKLMEKNSEEIKKSIQSLIAKEFS